MIRKPELLSPAGDSEALRAAVCAGADAVYLGYSSFGARASAVNFDAEALDKAVKYAHLYHVRVHVTVNTLIKQSELERVYEALNVINGCGADAVIAQDMGVALMVRECFPRLSLHASTQMALCDPYGARFAKDFGFDRVVLARECPISEIADVCRSGIDTEVFVHGALCAGVSGQCLMSSLSGGRSGNRGRCAQPCRQTVALSGESKAFLSMRDLMLRDRLPQLVSAGVSALKIEGRLKRAEYVSVVTESYRKALDALAQGRFEPASEEERTRLLQAYHRGGFTQGHAFSAQDSELTSTNRVGHGGVYMGRVTGARSGFMTVLLERELNDGDGLHLRGREDSDIRYSGTPKAAGESAVIRLREGVTARAGDDVYRLTDAVQDARAMALTEKPIPVRLSARIYAGEPMTLTATDGSAGVTVAGEAAQIPRTRALTREDVQKQLGRLGDTPFTPESIEIDLGEAFAPAAQLNALRREALDMLKRERIRLFGGEAQAIRPMPDTGALACEGTRAPGLIACTRDASVSGELLSAGADMVMYAPEDMTALEERLSELPERFILELPPQLFTKDVEAAGEFVMKHNDRIECVALGSVGQLGYPWQAPVAFSSGVPVCNRLAARALINRPLKFYSCWQELSYRELIETELQGTPRAITVYGRETVMYLNHCPARVKAGLSKGHKGCRMCDSGDPRSLVGKELTDRKGYAFPMVRTRLDRGCVVSVLSAMPIDLGAYTDKIKELSAGAVVRFTTEPRSEQIVITRRFADILGGKQPNGGGRGATAGRFIRGVE